MTESVTIASPFAVTWYGRTAHAPVARPSLDGTVEADVAVLGAGFTGLSAALDLAARGYKVAIVEARHAGAGASGRNGGQIVTGYNGSMAKLERLVGRDDAARLWHFAEEAKRLIEERIARHTIDCSLTWGYLYTALKKAHIAELDEMVEEWARYGYGGLQRLDRDATQAIVRSPRYIAGLSDPGAGHLHPLNYALGLAAACDQAGIPIFEQSPVIAIETGAKPALVTSRGRVEARYLIVAGNALMGGLAPAIMRKIVPIGTYMVATEPLGDRMAEIISRDDAICDLNHALNYFRRTPDNRLLFGARVTYTGREPANLRAQMLESVAHVFPQLASVRIDDCWGGLVDISVNRLPHIGRLNPRVYFAQGFSGHGVALTGMAGRVIAEAIAGTAERFDVFARIPHRDFPGGPLRIPVLAAARLWFRLLDLL